ncbi:MAG: hypothetical protein II089_00505 [Selenomonas sp.]|nr:hypothetical protein [Selenomonas sp.]
MYVHETIQKMLRPVLLIGVAACFISGIAVGEPVVAAANSVGTAVQKAAAVSESRIQPIVGTWREAGAADARSLVIYADGKYEMTYKDGKSFGMVKVTTEEHPYGSKSYWYSFLESGGVVLEDKNTASPWYSAYTSANEQWAAFARDEKAATQTDLYSGHDGAMHFVRYAENGYAGTGFGIKADDYVGIWSCGRCNAVISREGDGYLVEIQWASSAAEGSRWVYHCTYDNYAAILFSNGNGTRTDYVYSEEGVSRDTMAYNDGRALFVLRAGKMIWQDKKENTDNGVEFIKLP